MPIKEKFSQLIVFHEEKLWEMATSLLSDGRNHKDLFFLTAKCVLKDGLFLKRIIFDDAVMEKEIFHSLTTLIPAN